MKDKFSPSAATTNLYLQEVLRDQAEEKSQPIEVRITGFGFWKRVIVPPNVYVVHTRQGYKEPMTIGIGVSFRYNPYRDAFLLIPATMQTIMINARSICRERQGILVQAYVQWIIEDIQTAYRKLDFSNPNDPTGKVREQLREQAEATIKDKVSTMSIDEVLSDKRSIMDELTHRLREVAEGSGSGLGLKIVTVQIKEAVISSARLWENLQQPFRSEKEQAARLAEMERERVLTTQDSANAIQAEKGRIASEEEVALLLHKKNADVFDRQSKEDARRLEMKQDSERKRFDAESQTERLRLDAESQTERLRLEASSQTERLRLDAEHQTTQIRADKAFEQAKADLDRDVRLASEREAHTTAQIAALQAEFLIDRERLSQKEQLAELEHRAWKLRQEGEIEIEQKRAAIANLVSAERINQRLVEILPEIVPHLPSPENLHQVQISSQANDALGPLFGLLVSLRSLLASPPKDGGA